MTYTVEVHEKTPEFIRVTILETTYHLIKEDDGKWSVGDFDECPVSDASEKYARRVLTAFGII